MVSFSPSASVDSSAARFMEQIQKANPRIQIDLIDRAFRFSWEAHRNQVRKSGEPFLAHPVAVALILAEQKLDSITIAAGLLHDVLEDTLFTFEQLSEKFGTEVAALVEGVTKIKSFQMKSRKERQAETYRKMLLSMAEDIRVIIIKFADRIHNLRTLEFLEPERISAIAMETLDIYAPLAHRLGMARIKWELEDLAFKHLHPSEYKTVVAKVVAGRNDRESVIENFTVPLKQRLESEKIKGTIIGRPKHFYSIYRKMAERNKPFEEIYDLLALRVITDSIADCYHALGIIHSMWKPIQERFKDYISTPKSNGYQSLHTTVVGDNGAVVEIQIRTWSMNQIAEDGVAAHWIYKDGTDGVVASRDDYALNWLKNLIEWQEELTDSTEFYEFFKIDLFHAEIFVFTPKGDLISLPKGATALDFAFAVHSQIGLRCIGAKVDGKMEPINKELKSGSTVEIIASNSKQPSPDWLREVRTPKARSAIRRWLKSKGHQESIELGKKILLTSFNKIHSDENFADHIPALLQHSGINNLDRLYELIGNGELAVGKVMQHFYNASGKPKIGEKMVSRIVRTFTGKKEQAVVVGGNDGLMVRFAKCCNPIPGDNIIGFITRGRGISVHRSDCPNVPIFMQDRERTIDVGWDDKNKEPRKYYVFLEIVAQDRAGLLHDITTVFFTFGANVIEGRLSTANQQVTNKFEIEIANRNQLKQIFRQLQRVKGVDHVYRIRDYRAFSDGSSEAGHNTEQGVE